MASGESSVRLRPGDSSLWSAPSMWEGVGGERGEGGGEGSVILCVVAAGDGKFLDAIAVDVGDGRGLRGVERLCLGLDGDLLGGLGGRELDVDSHVATDGDGYGWVEVGREAGCCDLDLIRAAGQAGDGEGAVGAGGGFADA